MILTLGVSLYTSRVVLSSLGIEDFGIYNLVGGIVVLFSFISGSMTSATQRFLNFELGNKNIEGVRNVFCISINVYVLIAIGIVLLAETLGLWFLNTKLNIPLNRMSSANIVYQFSILTFIISILKVPYNASIVAYEKMEFYAWTSIVEVILKLLIVLSLVFFYFDKLILYSGLTFSVAVIMFVVYQKYCRQNFVTCHYKYLEDRTLLKKLLNFSGWSMFGSVAVIGSNQGIAMVLNVFLGVTINAAMGIANQVNTALNAFVSNFRVAFSPQIVKTYAAGNIDAHKKLIFQTSKFSYYLLLLLAVPVLLHTKFILNIWLTTVPPYAVVFTQLTILLSLIEALSGPFWMSVGAIGNIKFYQIIVSGILLLNLPLAYLVLFNDFSPQLVLVGKLVIGIILFVFRLLYVKQFLEFTIDELISNLLKQVVFVTILIISTLFTLRDHLMINESTLLNVSSFSFISILISFVYIVFIGISKMERKSILELLKTKFR